MRYPGGKGQAGVYQRIINLMPPHDVYIETHLGGGNILERKKPAQASIAIDCDAAVIAIWKAKGWPSTSFICGDARSIIASYDFTGRELIYCDPPYVRSARRSSRPLYTHEYSDEDHRRLLSLLLTIRSRVMISGYRNAIYDELLAGWQRIDFRVKLRGAAWATESLWLNFQPAAQLHDYRYLGGDFRERERIKRKQSRWRTRLARLPASERAAMLQGLLDLDASAPLAKNVDAAGERDPIAKNGAAGPESADIAASGDGGLRGLKFAS